MAGINAASRAPRRRRRARRGSESSASNPVVPIVRNPCKSSEVARSRRGGAIAMNLSSISLPGKFGSAISSPRLAMRLDMTEGQPVGHCARCCWIGTAIGREIGLTEAASRALLHDPAQGSEDAAATRRAFVSSILTDDIDFKRDFKQLDGSLPKVLRFVLGHTGMKSGLAERFRAIVNIFQNGGEIAKELIEARCQRGAEIATPASFLRGCRDEHPFARRALGRFGQAHVSPATKFRFSAASR